MLVIEEVVVEKQPDFRPKMLNIFERSKLKDNTKEESAKNLYI